VGTKHGENASFFLIKGETREMVVKSKNVEKKHSFIPSRVTTAGTSEKTQRGEKKEN